MTTNAHQSGRTKSQLNGHEQHHDQEGDGRVGLYAGCSASDRRIIGMLSAQAASNAGPWWAVPVVAGLFATLGVAASQVTAWILDRRKTRRDHEQHWLSDRRSTYALFLAATTALYIRIWTDWETGIPEGDVEIIRLLNDVKVRHFEVELIASGQVREAADQVFWEVGDFLDLCDKGNQLELRDQPAKRVQDMQDDLIRVMRSELGTKL